ncbi:MAG: cyclase family protein [Bdellovibrionales bacterium]|nr:cyclase family protein [Bdellovibrionales bacterium]NQZ18354.1 cyclase family protein [Bdellovibrionales bacterium]
MKIINISPEISSEMAVWPGVEPFKREVMMDTNQGDHIGLSKISTILHIGAHVDAPNHYVAQGKGISERSLHYYIGPCQVIDCKTERDTRVAIDDLSTKEIKAPRVLLRTSSFPDQKNWNTDFCSLSEELVDWLAEKHVILVGIDTPSIDPFHSKKMEAHLRVAAHNMSILEGIVLDEVEDGVYELNALPLPLKEGDASPVRAVLIQDN